MILMNLQDSSLIQYFQPKESRRLNSNARMTFTSKLPIVSQLSMLPACLLGWPLGEVVRRPDG